MKIALLITFLTVVADASDLTHRIADILRAENTDLIANCNEIKTNSQLTLGHKIAQVVCEEQISSINKLGISIVKFLLFGVICSITTYLVFASHSKVQSANAENLQFDEMTATPQGPVVQNQHSETVQPQTRAETCLQAVELPQWQVNVLPQSTNDTSDVMVKEHSEGDALQEEETEHFEAYKHSIERQHTQFYRPRSFSDPKGCQRFVQYPFTIEDAIQQQRIGEPPLPLPPALTSDFHEETEDSYQPGSPHCVAGDMQPGCFEQVPSEQKINERKPMVFVGGVSASTTPLELVTELKKQGFNVTVLPRIRYGVSFGFCPDLVLSSEEEEQKLLAMERVWIKDRWIDIRPYVPKEEPHTPNSGKSPSKVSVSCAPPSLHDGVYNGAEYVDHQDINSSCSSSPTTSQNMTPSAGNSSPVTPGNVGQHHFFQPQMNPPFFQMPPVMHFPPCPNYPMMHQQFYPDFMFHPHQMMQEKHPMQMCDEPLADFHPVETPDFTLDLQQPPCNGASM